MIAARLYEALVQRRAVAEEEAFEEGFEGVFLVGVENAGAAKRRKGLSTNLSTHPPGRAGFSVPAITGQYPISGSTTATSDHIAGGMAALYRVS